MGTNPDLRQMLFRVQDDVDRDTKGRQRPELSISLVGEFKLKVSVTTSDVRAYIAERQRETVLVRQAHDVEMPDGSIKPSARSVAVIRI